MCGICGFWTSRVLDDSEGIVRGMTDALSHRGPDGTGVWQCCDEGIHLGHSRLAIIDLSSHGHQPMQSASGRYVLTYNGEIYNHLALRASISTIFTDISWRGDSDTETLLAAIDRWGVQGALERVNGMFAFALWDRKHRKLTLARDKVGEKPLYFLHQRGLVAFASELQPLKRIPGVDWSIDKGSLSSYFTQSYVPAPHTIFSGVSKLQAGQWIEFTSLDEGGSRAERYWTFEQVASQSNSAGSSENFTEAEWQQRLKLQLRKSVASRMHSDVPLGSFLSGGIDSSLVTAMMQDISDERVKTFSIGFEDSTVDESHHARAVANHIGTEHTEFRVSDADALATVPRLPDIWDEPFADSSQIPTFLMAQLTSNHVTVALSGDGGDELFGGYSRYLQAQELWQRIAPVPQWLRSPVSHTARLLEQMSNPGVVPDRVRSMVIRMAELSDMVAAKNQGEMYLAMRRHWKSPEKLVLGAQKANLPTDLHTCGQNFTERMMLHDSESYLPDDILTKIDRATMACSLESRAPLLDPELIELAWQMPFELKVRNRQGKYLLRQVLYEYVPQNLVDRPKSGFSVPLNQWLKGPLKEWAEDLLEPSMIRRQGFLNPDLVQKAWSDHQSGVWDSRYRLWDILMFQAWLCSGAAHQ